MEANKLIVTVTKKKVDLDIAEITLLSNEEYTAAKDIIPARCAFGWWLRSSCSNIDSMIRARIPPDSIAGIVTSAGHLSFDFVNSAYVGVSPALRIRNLISTNLNLGDKFELAGHTWTVISDNLALCDDIVGETYFREDWKAKDANVYDASDIKKWLKNWAAEKGILIGLNFEKDEEKKA